MRSPTYARKIAQGIDVIPALSQIAAAAEFWGQFPVRTEGRSPHRESRDIWLRFRAWDELTDRRNYGEPHFAVWYPAWHALPALHPIVFDIARQVEAEYIGGILLTSIPAGARIYPHHDRGSWHAEWLNTKVYVILSANDACINRYESEEYRMRTGEAWQFDNQVVHSVENNGETDRISLIITMRTE
jgi:aspartyl/asparaginyl beta-hydroxylase